MFCYQSTQATLPTSERAGYTCRINPSLPVYSVLLQLGFTEPSELPHLLVSSYLTVSPSPAIKAGSLFSVALSPGCPGLPLTASLPCRVPTFLSILKRIKRSLTLLFLIFFKEQNTATTTATNNLFTACNSYSKLRA